MKHRIRTWLTLMAVACLTLGALAAGDITVTVDGRPLSFDQSPLMQGGRVLVPLRGIFEALGAKVEWDAPSRTVRATSGDSSMMLPLGSRTATVNGGPVTLDVPAAVVGGRTVVPLRFVAEALGAEVRWDGAARRVAITSGPAGSSALPTPFPGPEPSPAAPSPGIPPSTVATTSFNAALDLPRIQVGNQAGLLKLLDRQRQKVDYFRTLDDRTTAPVTAEQRATIGSTLGFDRSQAPQVARQVMSGYASLPKLPALALLGVIGSEVPEALDAELARSLQDFAVNRARSEKDNVIRRQALLSLALMSTTSAATTEAVLKFYETEDNLWVTFPVQMFFQYHAAEIRALPEAPSIRARVAAVPSLYTEPILSYLGPGEGLAGRQLPTLMNLVRNLSGRGLQALPGDLAEAPGLRQLSLAGNRLVSLPDWLTSLVSLRHLDLSGNLFQALPSSLTSLADLEELDLSGNVLTGLPADLSGMASLKVLDLRGNLLTDVPADLGRWPDLEILDLTGNPLPVSTVERLRQALPDVKILF